MNINIVWLSAVVAAASGAVHSWLLRTPRKRAPKPRFHEERNAAWTPPHPESKPIITPSGVFIPRFRLNK